MTVKDESFGLCDAKLEGKYTFGGSHCLCNCLLDVVCNLQIIALLKRRF